MNQSNLNYFAIPGLPNSKTIPEIVASYFGLTLEKLMSRTRKREIVTPRQIATRLIYVHVKGLTLEVIGKIIGGSMPFDHANVLHSVTTVQNLCDTDPEYLKTYREVEREVLIFGLVHKSFYIVERRA